MKITPVAHGLDLLAQPGYVRGKGVHLSDLYNGYFQTTEPKRYKTGSEPNQTLMSMGLAWEQFLERLFEQQGFSAVRPGEFVSPEGIILSPDLLIFNGHERIGEIKLTKMAYTQDLSDPKFDKWLTQVKGYAHVLEIPRARFYVLFVNGDCRDHRDPILQAYDIEFTPFELVENWRTLMNFGKQRGLIHD